MKYKVDYKGYEFILNQNEDGSFNIPEQIRDLEPFGTALKPAAEYIVIARKPLSEKSVAENVLKWRTGGLNIDGCRIEGTYGTGQNEVIEGKEAGQMYHRHESGMEGNNYKQKIMVSNPEGRFPANIIFECICDEVIKGEKGEVIEHGGSGGIWSEGTKEPVGRTYNDKGDIHTNPDCTCYQLDQQSGNLKSTGAIRGKDTDTDPTSFDMKKKAGHNSNPYAGQSGGASRFFYVAKVSKKERNLGLDAFEDKETKTQFVQESNQGRNMSAKYQALRTARKNTHPTVKPINLLTYLCRLITPPNGIILDPFMGSGSTGIAAQLEGFRFVGMELDEDYFKIAEARISNWEQYKSIIK